MAISSANIEQIRGILKLPGWREVMAPEIAARMDMLKNNLVAAESKRDEEWKSYSNDRLGGMVEGLGWALNIWMLAITKYDQANALAAAEKRAAAEADESVGHPYRAPDPEREST